MKASSHKTSIVAPGSGLPLVIAAALVVGAAWQAASAASDPAPAPVVDPLTQAGAELALDGFGVKHVPSSVIFPAQSLPLRFSHEAHLGLITCKDCHGMVNASVRAKDVNLPPESTCTDCHDIKAAAEGKKADPPSSCDTCHPGFVPQWLPGADMSDTSQVAVHPPASIVPEPNLKFNHKVHVDKGVKCETCHAGLDKMGFATVDNALPVMGTCLTCHDGKQASSQCRTCHLADPGGKMETHFASGKLEPGGWYYMDAHDDGWLESHRNVAVLGDGKCEACHKEKECVDCHNGVKKPLRIHPNDWITQHPTIARKNDPSCGSCHRSQTFCVDCHQATKVAWEEPNRPPERVKFHPDGWLDTDGVRGPNHHAFQAQRNIQACASCHTEQTCIACHSSLQGSRGINPHPPGWAGSGDCTRMRDKNERVCYKCHAPTAQEMRCGL